MMRLSLFFALLFALPLAGIAQKTSGSRYKLRDTFLRFSGPNCYEITREEGLRALKARDWDLSASLFRSAKNCTDANEKRRAEMSSLIGESQAKAKNELIEKEREATRIARHAIASNRAEDAQELLRSYNRSLAFRLADFADRFIAPPDDNQNADCVQALLDAWNYSPYYHSNTKDYPNVQLPFCFQVVENLGQNAQIRYAKYQGKSHLFAFSPVEISGTDNKQEANKAAMLYWWDAETLERRGSMRLDKDLTGFDVAPDGRTLIFVSKRQFLFWRGPGESMTLDAPKVDLYSFDDESQKFYYYLPEKGEIHLKNIPGSFLRATKNINKRTKGNFASTPLKEEIEPVYTEIAGAGLLKFSVRKAALWLAYFDRIIVIDRGVAKTFPMPYNLYTDTKPEQIMLWPEVRKLQFTNDSLDILYLLPLPKSPDSTKVEQIVAYGELPLASDPTGSRLLASYNHQTSHVYIRENARDIRYYSTPSLRQDDAFKLNGASLSPDGQWLAAVTSKGMLMAYSLGNELHNSSWPFFPTKDFSLQFTPDGYHFVVLQDDSLRVFDANDWHNPRFTFKSGKEAPTLVLTNNLLAYRSSEEALKVFRFSDRKQFDVKFPLPFGYVGHIVDLDSVNNRIVHASGQTVTIEQLGNNSARWTREFEGRIQSVYFVPQTKKLMVLHESSGYNSQRSSIKFWSYEHPSAAVETLRTSDFKEGLVTFSPNAQLIALANEEKIWIYNLKDLSEEQAFIYKVKSSITAMTFSPDNKAIVVGFESGDIKGYDVSNGNVIYKIPPISNEDMPALLGLYFYDDGRRLRQVLGINVQRQIAGPRSNYNSTNTFVSRQMETKGFSPQLISGDRQLVSFSAEQIRTYELERALDFGDNFRMLAESGDLPLIRSFFDYYLNEAKQSNNSELVGTYCYRAFDLFDRLDIESQRVLQADMVNMNEDLIWKLLLRGKTREASAAILKANAVLDKPLTLYRYSGHAALLRGELQNASRFYTDWLIHVAEKAGLDGVVYGFETLNQDFLELNEYGLIDERQNQLLCSMFGANNASINDFLVCDSSKVLVTNQMMDAINAQRWNILTTMMTSKDKLSLSTRKRELLALWPEAQKLTRIKPAQYSLFEMLAVEIARTYKEEGEKVQDAGVSIKAYLEALEILKRVGNFQNLHIEGSVERQDIYLALANKQKELSRYAEAKINNQNAIDIISDLKGASSDYFDWAISMSDAHINLGMLLLYENKIAQAEALFALADSTSPGEFYKVYFGHAALLRGERDDALLAYGSIFDSHILADVLFEIERFIDRYPEKQAPLKEMAQTLLNLLPQIDPETISVNETKYWFAEKQMRYFNNLHKWRDARYWSLEMVALADEMMTQNNESWLSMWVDAYVSASYYHLFESKENPDFLDESIRFAQTAMAKTKDVEPQSYSMVLMETNLAHAFYLRNKPGDKEMAIKHYRHFLEQQIQVYDNDLWEMLTWDFMFLHNSGIKWPDLRGLINQIKPDVNLTESEWKNMGG